MNPFDQPTQPTEAHRKLWTALYNLAHREIFEDYAESSEGPATQLIADSEARAVEVAFPDSGDDSLYNVRRLRAELTAAKAECERLTANQRQPAEDIFVSHLCDELARLRAELAVAENWVEHHSAHADDLIGENVRLRALSDQLSNNLSAVGAAYNDEKARAEKAEAERDALAKDKERLDWLAVSDTWFDYPATESFNPETFRAAIDAAMKGTPTL